MSTPVVSTRRYLFFAAAIALSIFPGLSTLSAQTPVAERNFGGRAGWDLLTDLTNVRFIPGWQGGYDVTLEDATRPVRTETDLLAGFDGTVEDLSGSYRTVNNGVNVVSTPRRFGSGAAGFDGTGSIAYIPGPEALFTPETQPGSFTIDFWLHPHFVTEGAVILRWQGALLNSGHPVLQDLRLEISDRRLHWVLTNLVVRAGRDGVEPQPPVRLSARRSLVPRIWRHHQLRFDAETGQLAYLVDGIPEDIHYLSDSGTEDGTRHSILFGYDTGDGLVVGQRYEGALDELRISRSVSTGPQPSRFTGDPGRVISGPIDLGGSGARLEAVETRAHEPGNTEIRGYYRIGNIVVHDDPRDAIDAEWTPLPPGGGVPGNVRGRFVQLRYDLLADARREESPRLQEVRLRYTAAVPPPPPRIVRGTPVPGGVEISWDPVLDDDVAGYRVYFGERPQRYTGTAGVISPRDAGATSNVTITGLAGDVPYVFAVESYDRHGQTSTLSREIEVRAGRERNGR